MRRARVATALALALATSWAAAGTRASGPTAAAILERAFEVRCDVDLTAIIELTTRDALGQELQRRFRAASKRIGGRIHSIGRLVAPTPLRGMTVLSIEAKGRDHDAFVYLPASGRVRRISSAQRSDAFFGTDLTYEDLERRRADDYVLDPPVAARHAGEPVWRIEGRRNPRLGNGRTRFVVARDDHAILEVQQFRGEAKRPSRVTRIAREHLLRAGDRRIPTRLQIHHQERGTTTWVHLRRVRVDPALDDRVFSLAALEARRPIPMAGP